MTLEDLLKDPLRYPHRQEVDALVSEAMQCLPANRTDLISRVSHSIRTPLAAILGFKEIMDLEMEVSEADRNSYDAIVESEKNRLKRFISTLQVFRHLLSGDLKAEEAFEDLAPYARGVLAGLLALGFKRIFVLVFHQGEAGELATIFRLVGARLITERRWRECGRGWWGEARPGSDSGFPSIAVRSVVHPKSSPPAGGDHAGINETSYMLAACPHATDMSRLGADDPWYTQVDGGRAEDGSAERGERMLEAMVEAWAEELASYG